MKSISFEETEDWETFFSRLYPAGDARIDGWIKLLIKEQLAYPKDLKFFTLEQLKEFINDRMLLGHIELCKEEYLRPSTISQSTPQFSNFRGSLLSTPIVDLTKLCMDKSFDFSEAVLSAPLNRSLPLSTLPASGSYTTAPSLLHTPPRIRPETAVQLSPLRRGNPEPAIERFKYDFSEPNLLCDLNIRVFIHTQPPTFFSKSFLDIFQQLKSSHDSSSLNQSLLQNSILVNLISILLSPEMDEIIEKNLTKSELEWTSTVHTYFLQLITLGSPHLASNSDSGLTLRSRSGKSKRKFLKPDKYIGFPAELCGYTYKKDGLTNITHAGDISFVWLVGEHKANGISEDKYKIPYLLAHVINELEKILPMDRSITLRAGEHVRIPFGVGYLFSGTILNLSLLVKDSDGNKKFYQFEKLNISHTRHRIRAINFFLKLRELSGLIYNTISDLLNQDSDIWKKEQNAENDSFDNPKSKATISKKPRIVRRTKSTQKSNTSDNIGKKVLLHESSRSRVYYVESPTGEKTVLKKFLKDQEYYYLNELKVLQLWKGHPEFVQLCNYSKLSLELEYINVQYERFRATSTVQLMNYITSLGYALEKLHCFFKLMHLDVKEANALFCSFEQRVKLIDAEFVRPLSDSSPAYCGTSCYMAPEVKSEQCITDRADVYSFGVVLANQMCGITLQKTKHVQLLANCVTYDDINHLIQNKNFYRYTDGFWIPKVWQLCRRMLDWCPDKRPSIQEITSILPDCRSEEKNVI